MQQHLKGLGPDVDFLIAAANGARCGVNGKIADAKTPNAVFLRRLCLDFPQPNPYSGPTVTKDIILASCATLLLVPVYAQQPVTLAIADVVLSQPPGGGVTTKVTRSGTTVSVDYEGRNSNGTANPGNVTGTFTLNLTNPALTGTVGNGILGLSPAARFTGNLTVQPATAVKTFSFATGLGESFRSGDCSGIYSTNAPATVTPRALNCDMRAISLRPLVNNWADVTAQISGIGSGFSVTVYYSYLPVDSVRFLGGGPFPEAGQKLPHSTKRTFRAQVNYALVNRPRAQLALRLYDKPEGGDLQGSSDFFPVTRTAAQGENFPKALEIIDFEVPKNLRAVFLQAVLIDEVNPGVLARSDAVRYPIPEVKVSISSIEAVQVVQTADNRVPLIIGKDTVFRVFVKQDPATPTVSGIRGSLTLARDTNLKPELLNSGPISAHGDPDRNNAAHSLNFKVRLIFAGEAAQTTLEAVDPAADFSIEHDALHPKDLTLLADYLYIEGLAYRLIPYCLKDPLDLSKQKCGTLPRGLGGRLQQIQPAGFARGLSFADNTRSYPDVIGGRNTGQVESNETRFLSLLHRNRLDSNPPDDDMWVALLPDGVGLVHNGLADPPWRGPGRGRVAWIVSGRETPFAQAEWALVHEVGHNLGLHHTNTDDPCLAKSVDSNSNWLKFYTDNQGNTHDPGFDIPGKRVIPGGKFDVMTYCPPEDKWISPFHYWQMMRQLRQFATSRTLKVIDDIVPLPSGPSVPPVKIPLSLPAAAPSRPLAEPSDFLLINGWAARDGLSAGFDPIYRTASTTPGEATDPAGDHCLEFRGPSGKLAEICFGINFTSVETGALVDQGFFATRVQAPAGMQRMDLVRAGRVLATVAVDAQPSLAITAPAAGARWEGAQTLSWNGSHPRGTPLSYKVDYSNNGGSIWTPLLYDLTDPACLIETQNLPAPGQYLFRVTGASGLDSASAVSVPVDVIQQPKLEVPAAPVNFGELRVGDTPTREVKLRSTGTGTLTVASVATTSTALELVDDVQFPLMIRPGDEDTLTFRFNAATAGRFTGTIRIAHNDPAGSSIAVEAVVISPNAPRFVPPDAGLDFGNVNVGQSRDLTLTLRNTGGSALSITAATFGNAQFRLISPALPASVAAGLSAVFTFRFSPTTAGNQSSTLAILSNDPLLPRWDTTLRGAGLGTTQPPPQNARLDFGNVNVGQSVDQTLTIRNTGTASLTVSAITSTNLRFTVTATTPFTIAAGGQQSVTVRFTPIAAGSQTGSLLLTVNDPTVPTITVDLTGTGVAVATGGLRTVTLQIDDGTFERGVRLDRAGDTFVVNRLTPPSYPATLKAVRIRFGDQGPEPGSTINVLAGTHAAGTETLGSPTLRGTLGRISFDAVNGFQEFTVPAVTITSGDFIVGFAALISRDQDAIPMDTSSYQSRSYISRNGTQFDLIGTIPDAGRGNFAIRAVVDVAN